MPNHGENVLVVRTPSGQVLSMRNQVCPCTGPLTSVARLIDADNLVGFSKAGSFILNLQTNKIDWLERKDDCFELPLEVLPYAEAAPMLKQAGFQGQS